MIQGRRQLEKVVNLDENSWTPTKIIKKEKLIEWILGHDECCSAPSPRTFPTCDQCEQNTFAKYKD